MRYITADDLKIFEQEKNLDQKVKKAEERWLKEVEKSHQGFIQYEDTKPLFDIYLEAHKEWKKYFEDNIKILLAQEQ